LAYGKNLSHKGKPPLALAIYFRKGGGYPIRSVVRRDQERSDLFTLGVNFAKLVRRVVSNAVRAALLLGGALASPAFAQGLPEAEGTSDYQRALTCLTQTISYEAGNEPLEGQEAVAQVVLNRVRHPAYPSTVCGVVYQGSTRKTGCQFTFTCDGSLKRGRTAASLDRSRIVAERVLRGQASTLVGGATHYHADYVSPYWAPSLIKVAQIGAHIFYRMPGAPDSPAIVTAGTLSGEPVLGNRGSVVLVPTVLPLPAPRAFSPWGLPVLVITKRGEIRPAIPDRE
jgi:Cell Wall Hydrolase